MARAELFQVLANPLRERISGYSTYSYSIVDSYQYCAFVFQAPEEAIITHIGFNINAVWLTSAADPVSYLVSLRQVEDNGYPSSTPMVSGILTPAVGDSGFTWVELNEPYETRRGEILSIMVSYSSGPIGSSDGLQVLTGMNYYGRRSFPYVCFDTGPSQYTGDLFYGIKSTLRAYGYPVTSYNTSGNINTPAQRGLRIFMNPAWGSSWKLRGAMIQFVETSDTVGKTWDMVLYQGTTELQRLTGVSGDLITEGGQAYAFMRLIFPGTYSTLEFGKEYTLAISPNEADTNLELALVSVEDAFDMSALPGGNSFYSHYRADTSSDWTKVRTQRPVFDLIIDDWTG